MSRSLLSRPNQPSAAPWSASIVNRSLRASSQPDGNLLTPFRDPLAPDRIGGHDVSQAERESNGVEQLREAHGKRDKICVDTRVRGIVVIGQDEPVVLIGRQQAFSAAGGTHDNERKRDRRFPPAVRCQAIDCEHERAPVQFEVDLSEQCLHLRNRHAVVQSVLGKIGLTTLDVLQAVEAFILHELVDQASEPAGEEEEHIVQREQPREPAGSVDHRDMAQAVPSHRCDRIEEMVVGGNGNDRRRHHVLDRLIGRRAPGEAPHHVLLRENAGRPAVGVRDDRHTAAGLRHAVHDFDDAGGTCDLHRLRPHVIAGKGAK